MKLIIISFFIPFLVNATTLTQQLSKRSQEGNKKMPENLKKIFKKSLQDLKKTGIEKTAKQKGAKAPAFKIMGIPFKNYYTKSPIVLKFYRGNWCPYCQLEMKAYEKYKNRIEKKGHQLIVLTPDSKKAIKKFKKKQHISFDIYQDKNNQIAKKFGVAFKLNAQIAGLYKKFNINLEKDQGNKNNELPLPGTYIINKEGIITYAFIDADYTKRLDPIELLKML